MYSELEHIVGSKNRSNTTLSALSALFKRKRHWSDLDHHIHDAGQDVSCFSPMKSTNNKNLLCLEKEVMQLHLSRQDNPFLVRLHKQKYSSVRSEDTQTLIDNVHSHLVRSPPPSLSPEVQTSNTSEEQVETFNNLNTILSGHELGK